MWVLFHGIVVWCIERLAWAIAPHLPVDSPHIRSSLERPTDHAEDDLLMVLRGHKSKNFAVNVCRWDGEWEVTTKNGYEGGVATGIGNRFREAWFSRVPVD